MLTSFSGLADADPKAGKLDPSVECLYCGLEIPVGGCWHCAGMEMTEAEWAALQAKKRSAQEVPR